VPDSNVDKRKLVLAPLSARECSLDADGFGESAAAVDLNERRGHLSGPIGRAESLFQKQLLILRRLLLYAKGPEGCSRRRRTAPSGTSFEAASRRLRTRTRAFGSGADTDGGGRTPGAARPPASRSESAPRLGSNLFAPLLAMILLGLSGCAVRGAPSFVLFGAFFPAWMFCAALGILAAIGARAVFVATGLAHVLPLQLFVCASIGVCAGLLAGLFWFEQ